MTDCQNCQAKDQVIAELINTLRATPPAVTVFQPVQPSTAFTPYDPTAHCPCRVENGGSGICGCIRGGAQVIC